MAESNAGLIRLFREMYEGKAGRVAPGPAVWENMAEEYEERMSFSAPFQKDMERRVRETADFLKTRAALFPGASVLDIGCGPGLFVQRFSQTAGRMVGIDISEGMITAAQRNNAANPRVELLRGDFSSMPAESLGGPYDLVFASITPAVSGWRGVEKMMRLSRRFCFLSFFVYWFDDLEKRISEELFDREYAPSHGFHDKKFYALNNLLWLEGYQPQTDCLRLNSEDSLPVSVPLAREYARIFSPLRRAEEEETKRIGGFLEKIAGRDGMIRRRTSYWYGQPLWDISQKTSRREYMETEWRVFNE